MHTFSFITLTGLQALRAYNPHALTRVWLTRSTFTPLLGTTAFAQFCQLRFVSVPK